MRADLHAGLSGLEMDEHFLDLGERISLRKTYGICWHLS